MTRPRVLLTGFGPFPGVAKNPSGWLAETLAGSASLPDASLPDFDLLAAVLPTEWATVATQLPRLHAEFQPDLAIHFGVSVQADGLRIERAAHNRIGTRMDASGSRPTRQDVVTGSPAQLQTRLPVTTLAARLRGQGINARVSNSCGRYLCNDLYYRSLHWTSAHGGDALFVHVPLADGQERTRWEGHTFSQETLLRAGHAALHEVAKTMRSPHMSRRSIAAPENERKRQGTRMGQDLQPREST